MFCVPFGVLFRAPCWAVFLVGESLMAAPPPLFVKIPNTDIKRLESLSSPSPNWHLSQKRVLWTQETDFLPERVSIATTASSKVPECLPPTSDFLPPRVPFRWHQAVGMSLRSPYQMFHSWQEQVYLLNKLLKLQRGWCIIFPQLQRQGCFHQLCCPSGIPDLNQRAHCLGRCTLLRKHEPVEWIYRLLSSVHSTLESTVYT